VRRELEPGRLAARNFSQRRRSPDQQLARSALQRFGHRRALRAARARQGAATVAKRPRPARDEAPAAGESVRVRPAAETAPRAVARFAAASCLYMPRTAPPHSHRSRAVQARTTHTGAARRERCARMPRGIVDTRAPPLLAGPRYLRSCPKLRRNRQTGTENRVPNAASAARAPPGAQAPLRSACCSAESTPTTPPRVLSSPTLPIDDDSPSLLSNTRHLEPHARATMLVSAAKRLRTRSHARSARITKLRASKKANSTHIHRRCERTPETCPPKSSPQPLNPKGGPNK